MPYGHVTHSRNIWSLFDRLKIQTILNTNFYYKNFSWTKSIWDLGIPVPVNKKLIPNRSGSKKKANSGWNLFLVPVHGQPWRRPSIFCDLQGDLHKKKGNRTANQQLLFAICWSLTKKKEGFISPKIFIYFCINSDSNLTQTQMLTLKLPLKQTLTLT